MHELLRVGPGFRLDAVDTGSTPGVGVDRLEAERVHAVATERLSALQERLFAASSRGAPHRVLLVLQGMDTAGKGGIVRHVVGDVDPQGVQIASFGTPTAAELAEHFLARVERRVPVAGRIGVFDRSHYEDVLIGRVRQLAPPDEIERRYDEIRAFEQRLVDDGTEIVKVMLHISPDVQKARLQERLDRPEKHWKYHPSDVDERMLWAEYQTAYQRVLDRTDAPHAPWYVVPADHKWYARLAVQEILLAALERIDPQWPPAHFDVAAERARLAAS